MINELRYLTFWIQVACIMLSGTLVTGSPNLDINRLKCLVDRSHSLDTSQVNACYTLAKHYLYDSTLQAQQYAISGIGMATFLNFLEGKGHCQNILAMSHEILGRLDEALIIYEEAFESLSEAGETEYAAGIIVNMGVAHYYSGNRGEALKYYIRALDYARENQLREQESKLLNNIAVIYRELKQYPQAIQIYINSLQIKRELDDSLGFANTLENLGLAYSYINDGAKAVEHLNEAIRWYVQAGKQAESDQAQISLGQVYLQLGNRIEAEKILTELISNHKITLLPHYKATCYLMLSKIKFEKSENEQALQLLDSGYELIENSDRDELKSKYLTLYTNLFRSTGHYEKALDYAMEQMSILDTLNQKNRIETEREMKSRFDLRQKEAKLIIQEQKISQQTSQRRWFAALLMISLVLLIVLAFLPCLKQRIIKFFWKRIKLLIKV
ncbi:MAG: tetratricopeptide repeat protein [Saprospiraceae bacterium]|nr:tetratricopeptide repeat protein [Saprospiraceae bacterium]